MIIVTTPEVANKKVVKTLGMVSGSTIQTRHLGKDILAMLKMLIGGELKGYTDMMANAREESLARMVEKAEELGANGVLNVRFSSVMVMQGSAESLAYGTAVILED